MTRTEAIDILKDIWQVATKDTPIEEALVLAIKALEESQWIPCSSGELPGEYMSFYATVKSLIDNRECWVIEGRYTKFWQWGKIPMIDRGEAEVIAWMPKYLPEPWRGDAE